MRSLLALPLALLACEPAEPEDTASDAWWATDAQATALWSRVHDVDGRSGVRFLDDGRVLFGDSEGRLHIEQADGQPLAFGPWGRDRPVYTPAVAGSTALLRNTVGELLAVDLSVDPPALLWESVDHLPVVAITSGGHVAVHLQDNTSPSLMGRDPHTGEILWSEDDPVITYFFAARGGRVCGFGGESGGDVGVVDALDGSLLLLGDPGIEELSSPFILQCEVYGDGALAIGGATTPEDGPPGPFVLVLLDASGAVATRQPWPFDSLPARMFVLDDDQVIVSSDSDTAVYTPQLADVQEFPGRVVLGVDPASGNRVARDVQSGATVLADVDWSPIWTGAPGQPTHAYRLHSVEVRGEVAYWTDKQEGVLGNDRWTRTMAIGLP